MPKFDRPLTPAELAELSDDTIDFSDIPEADDEFWSAAEVQMPEAKTAVYLRIDTDVLRWFKGQGRGYQTRINAVLRSYYRARRD